MRRVTRISRREHQEQVRATLDGLAALTGAPPPVYSKPLPEKRGPRQPSAAPKVRPERLILRDILRYLRDHPKVAFCMRMQSGLFQQEDRPIRVGTPGMPDIVGMLLGGRLFAIEVKSETGRVSDSQALWIDMIVTNGGRGGIARSVADASGIIA